MESSESSANIISLEIWASWGEEVRTTSHFACECLLVKSHTNSSHLSSSEGSIDHHVAPFVHLFFPVLEAFWDDFWDVVSDFLWSLTNCPEKAPFGIKIRREFREWVVLWGELIKYMLMISSSFLLLWSNSSLEVELWLAVSKLLSCVELSCVVLKVLLH